LPCWLADISAWSGSGRFLVMSWRLLFKGILGSIAYGLNYDA
jgi:hypothetical protein